NLRLLTANSRWALAASLPGTPAKLFLISLPERRDCPDANSGGGGGSAGSSDVHPFASPVAYPLHWLLDTDRPDDPIRMLESADMAALSDTHVMAAAPPSPQEDDGGEALELDDQDMDNYGGAPPRMLFLPPDIGHFHCTSAAPEIYLKSSARISDNRVLLTGTRRNPVTGSFSTWLAVHHWRGNRLLFERGYPRSIWPDAAALIRSHGMRPLPTANPLALTFNPSALNLIPSGSGSSNNASLTSLPGSNLASATAAHFIGNGHGHNGEQGGNVLITNLCDDTGPDLLAWLKFGELIVIDLKDGSIRYHFHHDMPSIGMFRPIVGSLYMLVDNGWRLLLDAATGWWQVRQGDDPYAEYELAGPDRLVMLRHGKLSLVEFGAESRAWADHRPSLRSVFGAFRSTIYPTADYFLYSGLPYAYDGVALAWSFEDTQRAGPCFAEAIDPSVVRAREVAQKAQAYPNFALAIPYRAFKEANCQTKQQQTGFPRVQLLILLDGDGRSIIWNDESITYHVNDIFDNILYASRIKIAVLFTHDQPLPYMDNSGGYKYFRYNAMHEPGAWNSVFLSVKYAVYKWFYFALGTIVVDSIMGTALFVYRIPLYHAELSASDQKTVSSLQTLVRITNAILVMDAIVFGGFAIWFGMTAREMRRHAEGRDCFIKASGTHCTALHCIKSYAHTDRIQFAVFTGLACITYVVLVVWTVVLSASHDFLSPLSVITADITFDTIYVVRAFLFLFALGVRWPKAKKASMYRQLDGMGNMHHYPAPTRPIQA
ncbi:hypothetical protein SYNPS1DRAFT_22782, partial [Syncephalis pseudoplumigaleata]